MCSQEDKNGNIQILYTANQTQQQKNLYELSQQNSVIFEIDKQFDSKVLRTQNTNSSVTFIANKNYEMGFFQRFLNLQIFAYKNPIAIQVTLIDDANIERNMILFSGLSRVSQKSAFSKVRMSNFEFGKWANIVIDLYSFIQKITTSKTQFLSKITIFGEFSLKMISMSKKNYSRLENLQNDNLLNQQKFKSINIEYSKFNRQNIPKLIIHRKKQNNQPKTALLPKIGQNRMIKQTAQKQNSSICSNKPIIRSMKKKTLKQKVQNTQVNQKKNLLLSKMRIKQQQLLTPLVKGSILSNRFLERRTSLPQNISNSFKTRNLLGTLNFNKISQNGQLRYSQIDKNLSTERTAATALSQNVSQSEICNSNNYRSPNLCSENPSQLSAESVEPIQKSNKFSSSPYSCKENSSECSNQTIQQDIEVEESFIENQPLIQNKQNITLPTRIRRISKCGADIQFQVSKIKAVNQKMHKKGSFQGFGECLIRDYVEEGQRSYSPPLTFMQSQELQDNNVSFCDANKDQEKKKNQLDLIFDPVLECYYDYKTHTYYELAK